MDADPKNVGESEKYCPKEEYPSFGFGVWVSDGFLHPADSLSLAHHLPHYDNSVRLEIPSI